MVALVFTTFVTVTDDSCGSHAFGPGDIVPGWARDRVGAHVTAPDPNAVPDAPVVSGAPVRLRDPAPVRSRKTSI